MSKTTKCRVTKPRIYRRETLGTGATAKKIVRELEVGAELSLTDAEMTAYAGKIEVVKAAKK